MAPVSGMTPTFLYLLFTATLGPLLFGYHLAELNAPQKVIACAVKALSPSAFDRFKHALGTSTSNPASTTFLPQCIPMDANRFGLVTSFFTLGGLVGALSAGPFTARYGRLRAMIALSALAVVGPAFEAAAPNVGTLTLGRLLSGVGAGGATVVVPIYISEIAVPSKRGIFGACTQIMVNVGILIAQALGLFLSRGQMWRIVLGVGGAIALVQMIGLLVGGQESHIWLADSGMPTQAKNILRKLRGSDADIGEEIVALGLQGGTDEESTLLAGEDRMPSGKPSNRETIGFFGVLRHPDTRPAVIAVIAIMLAQQFTGINSIIMYGVGLLSDLLAANAAILNVVVAAVNIVVTASCAPLADAWGRKKCILLSIAGMGVSSILLAFGIMRAIPILSAIAVTLFVASFGLGLGPIPFILASELVNSEAVGATQSWALGANWTATFIVAQFFPLVNSYMGKGQVYFLFAAFALFFGTFIAWWVPETRGKRDADEVWGRKKEPNLED